VTWVVVVGWGGVCGKGRFEFHRGWWLLVVVVVILVCSGCLLNCCVFTAVER
jgi:hypothetical protein